MMLLLDLDSLVERVWLLIFALTSLLDPAFCHTRSMMLFSFPFLSFLPFVRREVE